MSRKYAAGQRFSFSGDDKEYHVVMLCCAWGTDIEGYVISDGRGIKGNKFLTRAQLEEDATITLLPPLLG